MAAWNEFGTGPGMPGHNEGGNGASKKKVWDAILYRTALSRTCPIRRHVRPFSCLVHENPGLQVVGPSISCYICLFRRPK